MGSKLEQIPAGKGPYSVSCTDLMTGPGIQGIFLRLYYPSQNDAGCKDVKWIPKKEYYFGLSTFLQTCGTVGAFILAHYFDSVTCHAKWDATFRPGERYPVIIFSHGLGAFRTLYSAVCIEMASRGFVVASVEHRDQSASATYYCKEKLFSEAKGSTSEMQEEWIYYRRPKANEDDASFRRQQVLQRADECIRALDLLLDINSGKPVANLLPISFDWTQVKVKEMAHLSSNQ
ncbi:platelet-activating factor acetylhydrolase [Sphaerodactylus townsendi]|uniref:Uncharacterized protein n=1 Tax=Sphaerodactylus townsendi TaxID=933632 RepID=A0ACB8GEZ3_9SAUR|nr:platelet-activating factor acetylhydrolase [Sphaerodactylus townsendi]